MHESIEIIATVYFLLATQLAFFGWRINREINVREKAKKTWIPVCDILNIINMILTASICIVAPLITGEFVYFSEAYVGFAIILVICHPINVMGHYGLLSIRGRENLSSVKDGNELDYSKLDYFPAQEKYSISASVAIALVVCLVICFRLYYN